jgi:hypothetical protein
MMSAHDIVCVHTMAGFLAGTESMFQKDGWAGTESHFGVGGPADPGKDGIVYQWVDTDFQADANLQGNARLISIETSDGGDETNPWSTAQLDAITEIIVWCCREYSIPAELIADSAPGRRGIGYHRQGIDPWRVAGGEKWSNSQGKVCPGDVRIAQLVNDIVPRVKQQVSPPSGSFRLESVSPESGVSGSEVVLTGSGFNEATGVSFGDVWVETWTIDDDTQITATVPEPLTSGSVSVTVTSADATSEAVLFTYEETGTPALSLWSISPESGVSGSEVVLTGSGFNEANGVSFGDVWVETWTIDDDTQITATVPEPLTSGSVSVTVTSADATSEAFSFSYEE